MRIGELAALAGVSARAVRHYHQLGLLPEPARLANGYRSYGLRDAVALTRIRRLTELGLGLEEVREVLAGDTGRPLADVLAELDADLARQERLIRERRARLAVLLRRAREGTLPAEGPVSGELAAVFGEMARTARRLPGPEPSTAVWEREVLTLLESTARPEDRERMLRLLRTNASAPEAMRRAYEAYALMDALAEAAPDDPRVAETARALAGCVQPEIAAELARDAAGTPPQAADSALLAALYKDLAPAQAEALRQAVGLVLADGERKGKGSR
ncbi:MerR family transcriptional regulator [Streptomyces gamaensis]|uniref:MerR family transcriptional regulator n=1 Tax=Streptomyces gamaensis TaxID=1763542 RepID=A0ABW0YWI5_9ACTN